MGILSDWLKHDVTIGEWNAIKKRAQFALYWPEIHIEAHENMPEAHIMKVVMRGWQLRMIRHPRVYTYQHHVSLENTESLPKEIHDYERTRLLGKTYSDKPRVKFRAAWGVN